MIVIVLILIYLIYKHIYLNNVFQKNNNKTIIKDGKLIFSEIIKTKYTLNCIIKELEKNNISTLEEVKLGIIINDKLKIYTNKIPIPLIFNGNINYQSLNDIKKKPQWLYNILKYKEIELSNVFYSFYVDDRLFIIQKDA